jgi:kinesin family protein 2/24
LLLGFSLRKKKAHFFFFQLHFFSTCRSYTHTHKFYFDESFDGFDSTSDLYQRSVGSLIENFWSGGTSTCFCFGQTASGKTHTLFGSCGGSGSGDSHPDSAGMYVLAARDVFSRVGASNDNNLESKTKESHLYVEVSMFEIYGQKVRDLLNDSKELAALEDRHGVLQLKGLTARQCDSMDDFLEATDVGRSARSTTATGANATSSRSHAAMLLRLVRRNKDGEQLPFAKFSLIDLAGSERGADNENTDKTTQMEGRQINTSLLALKEVIRAKELGRSHAPFRQSRLTQILEESLTGSRCQTVVIGCISPAARDIQQSLNTLRCKS